MSAWPIQKINRLDRSDTLTEINILRFWINIWKETTCTAAWLYKLSIGTAAFILESLISANLRSCFNIVRQTSKFNSRSLIIIWVDPNYDDGKEADCYEDDVEAEQQAVYDETHLHPLLCALAVTQLLLHLEPDGLQIPAQAPQLLDGPTLHCWLHGTLTSSLPSQVSVECKAWVLMKILSLGLDMGINVRGWAKVCVKYLDPSCV